MRIIQEVKPARGIIKIMDILNTKEIEKETDICTSTSTSNSTCDFMSINLESDKLRGRNYDNTVDFRYICIKKEHFDVNMIYLKYTNLKKENYIEIIYKSPSIFLDGLFFKTPPLNLSQLSIITKEN